tara:strand:+ start:372 stop:1901 length:1530 start_codon:yes stop_codon:yes gene_type:complete
MSTLTQFTVTGKEKDDFYGFNIAGQTNQVINRTVTKKITGKYANQHIYEFALSSAYDASTLSFTTATSLVRIPNAEVQTAGYYNAYGRSFFTKSQAGLSTIEGISFNNNGTQLFAVDSHHARIMQYALSSAYDVTTLSFVKELDVSIKGKTPVAITFNNDGSKMFIIENGGNYEQNITGGKINEYALSTNYDIATATFTTSLDVSAQDANMKDLYFNDVARGAVNPGELLFVVGDDGNDVNEYLLTTAYDLTTASFVDSYGTGAEDTQPRSILFDNDGDRLYVIGQDNNKVSQYPLVTGFDISTTQAVTHSTAIRTNNIQPKGMSFNNDGTKLFVVGVGGSLVIDNGDDEQPITHEVRSRNTMKMYEGFTYVFDVSDSNLKETDLKFSTTEGGTRGGGTEYTTNVTTSGTIGTNGATVTIQVPRKPVSLNPGSAVGELFYYESNFTDTGGKIFTPEWKFELQLTKTDGADNIETRFETKEQEDIFKNSFFMRAGLTFSVDNGDLKVELN